MHRVEEGAGQVGAAPFAAAGVLIEGPEGVPMIGPDRVAGQHADGAAELRGGLPFLADRLALARGEVGKEGVEVGVGAVFPVILMGGAAQKAHFLTRFGLFCRAEGDMGRGKAVFRPDPHHGLRQRGAARVLPSRPGQETPPGRGREGDGGLQFGVIAPARALVSVAPGVVKDVFALAVGLGVKRHDRDHVLPRPRDKVMGLPAALPTDGARGFQRPQKAVRGEGIDRAPTVGLRAGATVPRGGGDAVQPVQHGDGNLRLGHVGVLSGTEVATSPRQGQAGAAAR